ncbi:hypothetical protein [Frankia sp. Cppng1_Ct_nod]|uniref:hypothetical protein n=1 Tax=Frankia sp. Cppng1_Ct_nod TaxID=2897162 RepID=UPI001041752C|nr:hypothetical protein [Frankia sp. Cppng1_Ct_nod]
MTGRAQRVPLLPLAVTALAAALVGWALLFRDRTIETTLAVVLVSVAGGVLLATLLVRPTPAPGRPPESARKRPPEPDRGRLPEPDGRWSRPGADRAEPEATQLVLPVGQPAGGAPRAGQWWNRDAPAAGVRAVEPVRPAPRDLAKLREAARVVQCPRCGAFRIDVRHTGTGYAFRCRVDDHEWTWRPGAAWPVTVVASRRQSSP